MTALIILVPSPVVFLGIGLLALDLLAGFTWGSKR